MAINKINKKEIIRCTPEEDAIINAQIAAGDPDEREWTEEDFYNAVSSPELLAMHPHFSKLHGFSHIKPAKYVNVGIDPDLARHFEKAGGHWKRRLNQTLREAVFGGNEPEK